MSSIQYDLNLNPSNTFQYNDVIWCFFVNDVCGHDDFQGPRLNRDSCYVMGGTLYLGGWNTLFLKNPPDYVAGRYLSDT